LSESPTFVQVARISLSVSAMAIERVEAGDIQLP
jgi:hypothetical protein